MQLANCPFCKDGIKIAATGPMPCTFCNDGHVDAEKNCICGKPVTMRVGKKEFCSKACADRDERRSHVVNTGYTGYRFQGSFW